MSKPKRILLKISGELIAQTDSGLNADRIRNLAEQIKQLSPDYQFSIVVGGGNFFRGTKQGREVVIRPQVSHYVGMLATAMNGLIIQDIFEKLAIRTTLFCALDCPQIGKSISPNNIATALQEDHCLIFTGGSGNPFFTTDTTAVLRALQIDAIELWKGTKVNGVYDRDPNIFQDAHFISNLTYKEALDKEIGIMDLSAFALAQQHDMPIRIFNIFAENALIIAAQDSSFGSKIQNYK